jgi:hypothetical protein
MNDPLTRAGRTYLANVERFSSMMEMTSRAAISRLSTPASVISPERHLQSDSPAKKRHADPSFLHLWYVVMLVTFGEAFLHDALAECAAADVTIMGNTEQKASYSEIVSLGTFEAIEQELRSRWARNFVDDGGPRKWTARLEKMFGSQYTPDAITQMEEAWGVRHMVVHHAGVTTSEFVQRHPILAGKAGERLSIPLQLVFDYASVLGQFVRVTDAAIGRRIHKHTF